MMATLMHRNSRVIDMISHTRLLDGVAVFDDAASFIPNSGYNDPRERHYISNQAVMDGGVLIRASSSPQHYTNLPQQAAGYVAPNAMNRYRPSLGAPYWSRNYRSQQEVRAPEASRRPGNLTHLTLMPSEEVAVLEISRGMHMQLEPQGASYEQLLELGERIGNVSTGLSEQTIASKLKTRTYSLSSKSIIPEAEVCTICQEEYKNQETIGSLSCKHEYHADCLKQWLVLKNECPMCRSTGLTMD